MSDTLTAEQKKWSKEQWAMYAAGLETRLELLEGNDKMRSQIIRWNDWGHFIQMDKKEWSKVKRWLETHGVVLEEVGQDGPVTKYRKIKSGKP